MDEVVREDETKRRPPPPRFSSRFLHIILRGIFYGRPEREKAKTEKEEEEEEEMEGNDCILTDVRPIPPHPLE